MLTQRTMRRIRLVIRISCLITCVAILLGSLIYWGIHSHLTMMQLTLKIWWVWVLYLILYVVAGVVE